jgi:tetratricopeptide (TPR) repeat protein
MANLWYRRQRLDEAIAEYRAALKYDNTMVIAHCSLARALIETNRPVDAVAEYRLALNVEADSVPCLVNFAWLLSAHREAAIRRPAEAVLLAERAVALTDRANAEALDALAAAYAADGRFDAAIAAGTAAVRLAERAQNPVGAADMRDRLALYRQRIAFIVLER